MLAQFIGDYYAVDRIITSPLSRAVETARPLAALLDLDVEVEERLRERVLSNEDLDDWQSQLRASFEDMDHVLPGGESNNQGLARVPSFFADIERSAGAGNVVVVSHGNLIALILRHFTDQLSPASSWDGYAITMQMTNPDVFIIDSRQGAVTRVWRDDGSAAVKMRPSARAILLNADGSAVFLFHLDDPSIHMAKRASAGRIWITPGGGLDPEDADLTAALRRELFEELGLAPHSYTIHGHLWSCAKRTVWRHYPHIFEDHYFVVQLLSPHSGDFRFENWSAEETKVLVGKRWWRWEELDSTTELIIPPQLKTTRVFDLLADLKHSWIVEEL
mgnify:FL=1